MISVMELCGLAMGKCDVVSARLALHLVVIFLEALADVGDLRGFNTSDTSSETEVADLDTAVLVDEDVSRLEIAVEHVGGVKILDCAK